MASGIINTGSGTVNVTGSAISDDDTAGVTNTGSGTINITGSAIGKGATVVSGKPGK